MQHECAPQMPEESSKPMWSQPKTDGWSSRHHREQTAGQPQKDKKISSMRASVSVRRIILQNTYSYLWPLGQKHQRNRYYWSRRSSRHRTVRDGSSSIRSRNSATCQQRYTLRHLYLTYLLRLFSLIRVFWPSSPCRVAGRIVGGTSRHQRSNHRGPWGRASVCHSKKTQNYHRWLRPA